MRFYVGVHHPPDAKRHKLCMVSINVLCARKSDFHVNEWLLDSGAFSTIAKHGRFVTTPEEYAAQVDRWARCGQMVAAVSQDYMCEPPALNATGLTIHQHQMLTIERYIAIQASAQAYIMPVLQGHDPADYVAHVRAYGDRLTSGMWVGVGSVCKRNARMAEIEHVLMAIRRERPDLRLHGFGVKTTALESSIVRRCLYSADSMAWSAAARREGRDRNSWREAAAFAARVEGQKVIERDYQPPLF